MGRNGIRRIARACAAFIVMAAALVGAAATPAGAAPLPGTILVTVVGAPGSYAYGFCPTSTTFLPWGNVTCADGSPNYASFTGPGGSVAVSVPAGDYNGVLATGPGAFGPQGPLTVVAGRTTTCTMSMTSAPACAVGPPTGTLIVNVGGVGGSYASGLCLAPGLPVIGSTACTDGSSANIRFGLTGGSTTTYSLAPGTYTGGLASLSPLTSGTYGPVYVTADQTATCTFTMGAAPACAYSGVTVPAGVGGGTLALTGSGGTSLTNVTTGPAPAGAPGDDFPVGVIGFDVTLPAGDTTADVVLQLPPGTNPNAYFKVRNGAWVDFTASTTIVGDTVTLHLVDNDSFDTDPTVGVIGDPGAPVVADKTGPVVTCPAPPTFLLYQTGTSLTANVSDAGSGVANPTVTVSAGTATVGTRTVNVTATDLAGNSTTQPCAYAVQYRFVGFGPPMANGVLNALKAGKSAPLTWWLGDAAYKPVSSASTFVSASAATVACPALPTVPVLLPTSGSGLSSLGLGVYVYEWKSSSANVGQCQTVSVTLADGTVHTLTFKLK